MWQRRDLGPEQRMTTCVFSQEQIGVSLQSLTAWSERDDSWTVATIDALVSPSGGWMMSCMDDGTFLQNCFLRKEVAT